ncbi:MAG: serine/threonine protein kinase, partial [Candidatus Obscuribacterales bacterium]|nr:serine/threonine protein kinase [Candidatus Obscuribacterales bacterium]
MHEDDASKNEPLIEILSPRYMPLEKISSGGMGLVYKAYDETLGKTVAIKMNILDSAEPEMVLRFQQEARAVSRLNHPNIIGVMDFGLLGDNQPYLVMEFAEGESLQQKLKGKGRFEAHEVIEILCQICDGMTHAHERGVIHRDLKPGNLMLEEDSEGRLHVRILDFGIARIERNQEEKGFSTRSGALIGSPLYMSPEQIRCLEIDQRSDVYSLGCIAYEMLSGRPPFEETSYVLTFKAHLEKASQPLPEDGPEDLLAGALNQVVLKCLSKSKEQRYESMLGLKEALLACKAQSIAAEPVDQNQASLKSGGSNRKLILVFSAVALVAFVCFSIFFNDRDRRPADDMIVTGDT